MQSLALSVEMSWFLHELQYNPDTSQLGALLSQREQLYAHTPHNSPAIQTNTTLLNSYEVYSHAVAVFWTI